MIVDRPAVTPRNPKRRYEYLLMAARKASHPLPEEFRQDSFKVRGCVLPGVLWWGSCRRAGSTGRGISDALITRDAGVADGPEL